MWSGKYAFCVDGKAFNFVTFIPRKGHVIMTMKLPKTKEFDERLEQASIETLSYDSQWREYRLRIESDPESKQKEVLLALAGEARENFGKTA